MADAQYALAAEDGAQDGEDDNKPDFMDSSEFDYHAYNTSLTNRLKQAWIVIMATM